MMSGMAAAQAPQRVRVRCILPQTLQVSVDHDRLVDMTETPKMRPLIYLDDVLQTGRVEIEKVPVSPDDPLFDPDELSILSGLHDCFVNGRLAHPVGPAVIDMDRQTIIWRFKTIS